MASGCQPLAVLGSGHWRCHHRHSRWHMLEAVNTCQARASFMGMFPLSLVILLVAALGVPPAPPAQARQAQLTVHEWGTFTSIAGPDGQALSWNPLDGPDDLPCFVDRYV